MKLIIPAAIERKLHAYVLSVKAEIAGMGAIEKRDDGNLYVTDIIIYDQKVTGGTADLSPEALAKFQTDLVKRGISPKNYYLWWHSHNDFGAFFSATDTGTIESSTEFDYLVSLVVNKSRQRKARLDMHRPFRLTVNELLVEVAPEFNKESLEIDHEINTLTLQIQELHKKKREGNVELPDVSEEVAAKVKIEGMLPTIGFGRNGSGKGRGVVSAREVLQSDLDGMTTEELFTMIDLTRELIAGFEDKGEGDAIECQELKADLETYYGYMDDMYGMGRYWDDGKKEWVVYSDDDDLPALPGGYKYGFEN